MSGQPSQLTEAEIEAALAKVSARARTTWKHLQAGKFYPVHAENTPKAMRELVDVGLVGCMGRVAKLVACFVPVGSEPPRLERIAGDTRPQID